MTSLTAIFGNSGERPEEQELESEKLLNLYWNRAELKKEFAELRNEKIRLQQRIEVEQGETARVQQKLDTLEKLLLDPEWVHNVVTYFQLRGLNDKCHDKLAKFAEQLKQQRERRLHGQLIEKWNDKRRAEARDVDEELGERRLRVQMLEDRLQSERHRLATMSGLKKLFRGRSVTRALDGIAESIEQAQADEQFLLRKLDEIDNRQPPDTEGLDVATKRSINFMILSFSQHLYLYLQGRGLAETVKEAGEKGFGAINYGTREDCDDILDRVEDRLDNFGKATDCAGILQDRSKLIAGNARFRNAENAVPVSASVATVYDFRADGRVVQSELNLLGEDYWKLSMVVSR